MKKFFIFLFFFFLYNNNTFSDEKDFISLINSFFDENEGVVVLNWEPVTEPKAFYKIYRLSEPLEGKFFIPKEDLLIKTVDYNISSIIDIPPATGKYYYYISVILDGKESNTILIDQNYTLNPVQYFKQSGIVQKIKGKFIPQNSEILITWDKPTDGAEIISYQIYRSQEPIDKKKIASAEKIATLPADKLIYFDKVKFVGSFYYAITTTSIHNYENLKLIEEQNVFTKPIIIATLDAKKLPDFFIYFPVDLNFDYQFNINWLTPQDQLGLIPLEIQFLETEKADKKEPVALVEEKKLPEKKAQKEDIQEPSMSKKDIKKELDEVNRLFSNYYKLKRWEEFLADADLTEKRLKSNYARKKLLFYKSIAFYYLRKYQESWLIIAELKTDKKFMKYNQDKLSLLEKKLKGEL